MTRLVLGPVMTMVLLLAASAAPAKEAVKPVAAVDAPWPEAYIEIFKLAPGKQEAFIRDIGRADEVSAAGGQPPIQFYMHEDGADWDVLLLKPEQTVLPTPAQEAAMAAKSKEMNMESGPAYFVRIRSLIASHTDTKVNGPLTAAQWLGRLDKWRAEHPAAK